MSAAPLTGSPARQRRAKSSKPKTREQLAFEAGENVLDGSKHGVTLLLYYKYGVGRCGKASSFEDDLAHLADENGVCTRTIRRYHKLLVETYGLFRIDKLDRQRVRITITAYEPDAQPAAPVPEIVTLESLTEQIADAMHAGDFTALAQLAQLAADLASAAVPAPVPEVIAVEPDPFFLSPARGSIDPDSRIDRSPASFNGDQVLNQQGATAPLPPSGGGMAHPGPARFWRREEPKRAETDAATILRTIGVSEQVIGELAGLDAGYVRQQLDAARRCGRARDVPAFLVGVLRTGGVFGASSWSDGPKARCATCGAVLQAGQTCPVCHPQEPDTPPDDTLTALWRRMLAAVDVSADDRRAWLDHAALLAIDGDVAIVGTSNLFVRNELRDRFVHLLVRPLAEELGRAMTIELVIGGVP